MLIDWSKFIPALLLLLTPVALLQGKRVRYRGVARDWEGYWGQTFVLWSQWADFLRAALGAWCLAGALHGLPGAKGLTAYAPFFVHGPVFMIATTLQVFVCREPDSANAPFAFVAGLAFGFIPMFWAGFVPFLIVGIAILLAVVFARGVHAPTAFFAAFAVILVPLGALFTHKKLLVPDGVMACAAALPWLLILLFPRDFVVAFLAKPLVKPPKKT